MPGNLYVHFPFCRAKCNYCALHSRAGVSAPDRDAYVRRLADRLVAEGRAGHYRTVYFGGGSPALCDLAPLLDVVSADEFTVELHPRDAAPSLLKRLAAGGVNRISMGVQSTDAAVLAAMGRGYVFAEAERAFARVKEVFDNAGIDLIVGYPGETAALTPRHARLAKWGLRHCSVYSLILEPQARLGAAPNMANARAAIPDDETVMNRLAVIAAFLREIGLERYEISNYAVPGFECRHNLAVWNGEDYLGIGDGAHGREGLLRTRNLWTDHPETETVTTDADFKERRLFRLRTRDGLDAADRPEWIVALDRFVLEGLVTRKGTIYRLTPRGMEVCDTVLAELV